MRHVRLHKPRAGTGASAANAKQQPGKGLRKSAAVARNDDACVLVCRRDSARCCAVLNLAATASCLCRASTGAASIWGAANVEVLSVMHCGGS